MRLLDLCIIIFSLHSIYVRIKLWVVDMHNAHTWELVLLLSSLRPVCLLKWSYFAQQCPCLGLDNMPFLHITKSGVDSGNLTTSQCYKHSIYLSIISRCLQYLMKWCYCILEQVPYDDEVVYYVNMEAPSVACNREMSIFLAPTYDSILKQPKWCFHYKFV